MKKRLLAAALAACALAATAPAAADTSTYAAWIDEMKAAERGPFSQIRWFCADGSVLPPRAYACAERGGGHQHGQWSERTEALRGKGFLVGNVLAGIDAEAAVARPGLPRRARAAPRREVPRRGGRRLDLPPGPVLPRGDPGGGRAGGRARSAARDGGEPRVDRLPLRRAAHGRAPAAPRRGDGLGPEGAAGGGGPLGRRRRLRVAAGEDPRDAGGGRTPAACARTRRRPGPTCARGTRRWRPRSRPPTRRSRSSTRWSAPPAALRGSPEVRDRLRAEAARVREAGSDAQRLAATGTILAELRDAVGRVRGAVGPAAARGPEPRRRGRALPARHGAAPRAPAPQPGGARLAAARRRRGGLRRRPRELPPAAGPRRERAGAPATRLPPRRLPRAPPRGGAPPRLGHAVAAHALLRAHAEARGDRAAGRPLRPGPAARGRPLLLLRGARRPHEGRGPPGRRRAPALRPQRRDRASTRSTPASRGASCTRPRTRRAPRASGATASTSSRRRSPSCRRWRASSPAARATRSRTCSSSPATSASRTWRWTRGSWRRCARTTGRRSSSR